MKNKKALVFGETKGLDETSDQSNFKSIQCLSQEKEPTFEFNETKPKPLKSLGIIQCFDCKQQSELAGYRFALVPLCDCCRTERAIEIANNRFERRLNDDTSL